MQDPEDTVDGTGRPVASPSGRRRGAFTVGLGVAALAVVVVVAVVLGQMRAGGSGAPAPAGAAADQTILGDANDDKVAFLTRALKAVTTSGTVLHTIDSYDSEDVSTTEPTSAPSSPATVVPGDWGLLIKGLPGGRMHHETETWIDTSGGRVKTDLRITEKGSDEVRRVQTLEESGTVTEVLSDTGPKPGEGWSNLSVRAAADQPPPDALERMSDDDPRLYIRLLESAAAGLGIPVGDAESTRMGTKVVLLGSAKVDGVEVYRVRFNATLPPEKGGTLAAETSVTADVRASDHLPVKVSGVSWHSEAGRRHTTERRWSMVYRTAEALPRSAVPATAFELDVPKEARRSIGRKTQPKDPALAKVPAWWLGTSYATLRWTGVLHDLAGADEYNSIRHLNAAVVRADQSRPVSVPRLVVAEYTPDGKPGNVGPVDGRNLKVISMPRLPRAKWRSWFEKSGRFGEIFELQEVVVDGKPGIALHQEKARVDSSGNDHQYRLWFDFLMFDTEDGTVLLQGAMLENGSLMQAAEVLVSAR